MQTMNTLKKYGSLWNKKSWLEYHDLHVQCDIFLLADVIEKFRNKCIEKYELDPAHFLSAPGLAWKACLKKTKVELELVIDIDMLLMVEKGDMLKQIINI